MRRTEGASLPLSLAAAAGAATAAALAAAGAAAARLSRGAAAAAPFFEHREHLAAGHRRAGDDAQFLEHAGHRRGDFEHHLVGLEIGEILIARHGLADLLVPGDERGVGDRLG